MASLSLPRPPDVLGVAVFTGIGQTISRIIRRLMETVFSRAFSSPKAFGQAMADLFSFIWRALRWFVSNSEMVIGGWIAIWTSVLSFVFFNDGFATALLLFTSGVMNMTSMVGLAVPAAALANIFAQQLLETIQNSVKTAFKKVLEEIRNFFRKVEDLFNEIGRQIRDFFGGVRNFFTGQTQEDLEMLQLSYKMLALHLDTLSAISPESEPAISAIKTTATTILNHAEAAYEDRKLLGSSASAHAAVEAVNKLQRKLSMQYDLLKHSLVL